MRKSRLQRFLDVFPFSKIARFLTIMDVCNLSFTAFYFHTRVYDQTEVSYQVSSTHLTNMYKHDCCGFVENNYLRVSNTNLKGGALMTQEQLIIMTKLLKDPPTTQAYMLEELHIEPDNAIDEPILYSFFSTLGGSAFCDFVLHLSLDGARLGAEGMSRFCNSIIESKPDFVSQGNGNYHHLSLNIIYLYFYI